MRILTCVLLAILALALAAGPVAAESHPPAEGAAAKSGEAAGKVDVKKSFGLERWDLGIWTLAAFFLLLILLGKFAWGPMMAGLDKREASLRKVHEDAEASREESKRALAEVHARLAKANDEVRAMLDEARRDAQVVKEQLKAEASAEIQAERERLRREIDMARDQALQEIYQQSVQLAAMISSKAVRRELTTGDHQRLIDDALAEMKSNMGTRA